MQTADPAVVALPEPLLTELSGFVTRHLGLRCSEASRSELTRGLRDLSRHVNFADLADLTECAQWLLSTPPEQEHLEILAGHLLIGETYFFREPASLETLQHRVLPDLVHDRRQSPAERNLRIWSAGCATGEEPYSIAMLLDRVVSDRDDWNITILATDMRADFLRIAAKGQYRDWSFRGVPQPVKQRFFRRLPDDTYELAPDIRRQVTFSSLNLASARYPSLLNNTNAMDVILCRNVLMYFEHWQARRVLQRFAEALTDGGWLVVGAAECSLPLFKGFEGFEAVGRSGAVLRQKRRGARRSASRMTAALPRNEPVVPPPGSRTERAREHPPGAREGRHSAIGLRRPGRRVDTPVEAVRRPTAAPGDAPTSLSTAQIHAHSGGLLDEALACACRAIATNKSDAGAHYTHACILNELGRGSEATEALRRAVYLAPDFALAHYMLGVVAHQGGNPDSASRHLKNALSSLVGRDPDEDVPEAAGLTIGRLVSVVHSFRETIENDIDS